MSRPDEPVTVLGAGLAGLSVSYHLGHHRTVLYEAADGTGGHARTRKIDGFVWDEGPHISFTKNEYVRELFSQAVAGEHEELRVVVSNYFRGSWIPHPAQLNLRAIPEPLRSECLDSFLKSRSQTDEAPRNYEEWLVAAFGPVFAHTFPAVYTRKYWTAEPGQMDVDWLGERLYRPTPDEVRKGAEAGLGTQANYITAARYPRVGGFQRYADHLARGARVATGKRLVEWDPRQRRLWFADRTECQYDRLVSTIPVPTLVEAARDAPRSVREAASALRCTELLTVEIAARHPARRLEHWFYVYDADMRSTRVSITERFSPANAPAGTTGIQVEVYGSPYRPLPADPRSLAAEVVEEVIRMGLVDGREAVTGVHTHRIPWANVIHDLDRRPALDEIRPWLDDVGVVVAGRFAEWAHLWSDDCVLSGRRIAEQLGAVPSAPL